MAKVRTPRSAWIDAGLQALAAGGPDAVRVEALAAGLGVTKGGFYWHFKDRPALLEEMLDGWEKAMVDDVIARVGGGPGDAREKLRELFALSPSADFDVELAVRDWARRDRSVAKRIRRVDGRRLEWLRSLFGEFAVDDDEAEALSMLAYSLLIGGYFISGKPGKRNRSEVMGSAMDRLLG